MILRTKIFLHSNRQSNFERGEALGLQGDVLRLFSFALYEVEFDVEVNSETGEVNILLVNGRVLEQEK